MINKYINKFLKSKNNKYCITDHLKSYTFAEVSKKVNFYSKLIKKINKKNPGIGILLDRNVDYLCVIFACMKVGAYYVPFSNNLIKKNLKTQIKDSKIDLLITYKKNKQKNEIIFKKIKNDKKIKFKNLSYIIFTSGSTGKKKGVMISQNNYNCYFKNISKEFKKKFTAKSLILNGEITFDIINADLVFALLFNCHIFITYENNNIFELCNTIVKNKIHSIYCVPSTWEKLIKISKIMGLNKLNYIKQINSGGEALSYDLYKNLRELAPFARIYNFYGPTEFTINSHYMEVKKTTKFIYNNKISIGKPFKNIFCKINILDKKDKTGELLLRGRQMFRGYINSAEKPYIRINKSIYYKTGDIFKFTKDKYFFIGRLNSYIKIKGFRVNLEFLENQLTKKFQYQCIFFYKNDLLTLVFEKRAKTENKNILKYVKSTFEKHERPNRVIFIKNLPFLPNGKLNRKYFL